MTTISKALVDSKYASNAETTEYTAAAGMRTIIDKISAYNGTGAGVQITVKLVPNGGAAGASNILAVKTIAAGATETFPEITGQTLGPGAFISVLAAAAASVVIRITGREVT